jgi:hypothetical protein
MIDPVFAHAGTTGSGLPHALVDAVLGIGSGLVIVAVFYLFLRFYAGSSRSEL